MYQSPIQRASHVPLYVQIEEQLLQTIRSDRFSEYAQIPSEHELAATHRVSRMTARKAIDRLVAAGVLFRKPGKGTFVAPPKIAHRASTQLSFAAAIADLGLQLQTVVLDAAVVGAQAGVASALAVREGAPIVFIRRLRVVEGQPAALHSAFLPQRFERILGEDLTGSLTDLGARSVAPLVDSEDAIEAVAARPDEAELLDVAAGTALIRHEGVGFSATGEPLRYTEGLYRSDRFRFSLNATRPAGLTPQLKQATAGSSRQSVDQPKGKAWSH